MDGEGGLEEHFAADATLLVRCVFAHRRDAYARFMLRNDILWIGQLSAPSATEVAAWSMQGATQTKIAYEIVEHDGVGPIASGSVLARLVPPLGSTQYAKITSATSSELVRLVKETCERWGQDMELAPKPPFYFIEAGIGTPNGTHINLPMTSF